ncbi:MAG: alpha/beta hydrolase [Polyangiales bacterium]
MGAIERTVTVNGIEVHCEERGDPAGEPLLLLHGFFGTGADWRLVFDLDALARGRRVIVPDARGHGRTDNPSGEFTIRRCALDALALLDALGVGRFQAVGVSLGAKTLLHVATQAPGRVGAMVLASAAPYFPAGARPLMRAAAEAEHGEAEWAAMRARHVRGDAQVRALWRVAGSLAEGHDDMNFTPPLLATVAAPTLLVSGDRDPFYPVELAVELYRAIPRASLWVVPGEGHAPVFGAAREAFAATAEAFLRGHAAAA